MPSAEPLEEPKKKKKPPFEPNGRIIGRAELARRDATLFTIGGVRDTHVNSLDLTLPSARAGFRYRSPIEGVTAKLSVEFTGKPKLKDGYVEAKGDFLGVRAGQFRAPSSVFEQDGRLSLATADRGFVNEILTDRLEIADRRPGLALLAYSKHGIKPLLTLGVFQGSYLADESTRDTELLEAQAVGAQSVAGRFEIAPDPVELGAYATYRVGTNRVVTVGDEPDHFWAGGVDAKLDAQFAQSGLRLWLDGAVGESWFSESSQSGTPKFASARFMAALRFGGLDKGEFYVEPFAMVGALDPDLRVTADFALELAAGLSAGYWKRGRLTLQAGLQRTERNFPSDYALTFYEDRRSILAQMVVEF